MVVPQGDTCLLFGVCFLIAPVEHVTDKKP